MSPEQQQINDLKKQVKALQDLMQTFFNAAQFDPQIIRTITLAGGYTAAITSALLVTDYDQAVNEGGAATYNVPAQFDGLYEINGKLVGYYDI